MTILSKKEFQNDFEVYKDCVPPGVLLPEIKIPKLEYKKLNIPDTSSNFDFLKSLCEKGIKSKNISSKKNYSKYKKRLHSELKILNDLGFIDYILLNWDILSFCHNNNIPTGPGRGSAAGSLVLYLIDVTFIDPVQHGLFFERFVSKSRAKKINFNGKTYLDGSLLADIDNDISYEHRQSVIKYIENKHPSRTAKILTLNKLSGKLCIRECCKIFGNFSEQEANAVSSFIIKKFGITLPLSDNYIESEEFKDWADKNPEIYKIALCIESLNKNTGVHPSGIAICHQDISNICPITLTKEGDPMTGYDMNWVASLMVKFDVLGLRTLSVINDTCKSLDIDPFSIDINSPKLYDLLNQFIETPHGLFQIEAETDFKVCKKVKPKNIEQLSAVLAIARPGALDFLDNYTEYVSSGNFQSVHPFFDEILSYTGGIPLYQEQLMQMAVKVGFNLDESEQLRRIVGKKKTKEMKSWKDKISKKIENKNLSTEIGEILWSVAEDSANYSFNKSHSIAYSNISAITAYLKFNYPQNFFLSLLKMTSSEPNPQDEISKISRELKKFKIKLLPPHLYKSSLDFRIEGNDIRYGLKSIKGISSKSIESLQDFKKSIKGNKYEMFLLAKQCGINIGMLSALIQAGALSETESNRSKLVIEAQLFNILTPREQRIAMIFGEKYDYDLINFIKTSLNENLIGDDNKIIIKESRYQTIKNKYAPYLEIYNLNKKSEKFANWFFENSLLGYSYSSKLTEIFKGVYRDLKNSTYYAEMPQRSSASFICIVDETIKGISRNGNEYLKIVMHDEFGCISGIFMDNRNEKRLTNYLNSNKKIPEKNSIILIQGSKGEDIIFINHINVLDEKIYMKLHELK
jgi:DNA polymerase-3 subunit alpha